MVKADFLVYATVFVCNTLIYDKRLLCLIFSDLFAVDFPYSDLLIASVI